MESVSFSTLREHLKFLTDRVADGSEPLLVTRGHGRSVVMLPEDAYDRMLEKLNMIESHASFEWLIESKKQLGEGLARPHNLTDD